MKCEKYWPDVGERKTYGDINVHCMSDERYADFTVTKLTLKKVSLLLLLLLLLVPLSFFFFFLIFLLLFFHLFLFNLLQ